jgi:hypothetical protein
MAIFVIYGIIKEMNTLNTRNEILLQNIHRRYSGKEISGDSSEQEQFIFISTNLSELMLIVRPKMTKNYLNLNSETSLFSTLLFLFFFQTSNGKRTEGTELISNSVYAIWNEKLLRSHFCCDLYSHSKIYDTLNGILKSNSFLICFNRNGFYVYC